MAEDAKHDLGCLRTDLSRWRLTSINGAHRWIYVSTEEAKQQPQSITELHFLGILKVSSIDLMIRILVQGSS